MRKGLIEMTLVQQPLEMGAQAVTLLNDYFREKTVPDVRFTSISPLGGSGITESSGESAP